MNWNRGGDDYKDKHGNRDKHVDKDEYWNLVWDKYWDMDGGVDENRDKDEQVDNGMEAMMPRKKKINKNGHDNNTWAS